MTKQVDFYFDFGSPNAYLAYTQLPAIAERTGAEIVWRPMLLGGVFEATGNVSPATVPAKRDFMGKEIERFIERHGVPFTFNPHFPVNTLALMRCAAAHQLHGDLPRYVKTCFEAMWGTPRNLNEPSEMEAMLGDAGFDPAQFAPGWRILPSKTPSGPTPKRRCPAECSAPPPSSSGRKCSSARINWNWWSRLSGKRPGVKKRGLGVHGKALFFMGVLRILTVRSTGQESASVPCGGMTIRSIHF